MFVKFHLKAAISWLFFILTSTTIYLQYFVTFFGEGGGLYWSVEWPRTHYLWLAGLELMTTFLFHFPECCWPYRCEALGPVISVPSEDVLEFLSAESWSWPLSFCSLESAVLFAIERPFAWKTGLGWKASSWSSWEKLLRFHFPSNLSFLGIVLCTLF